MSLGSISVAALLAILASFARAQDPAPLFQLMDVRARTPHRESLGEIHSFFPVPQAGAIGTTSLKEAVTLLTFEKDEVRTQHLFRSAAPSMGATGVHMPVISPDLIGLAQERRFLLFDFKARACGDFTISGNMDDSVEKMEVLDPQRRLFLFEINHHLPESEDYHDAFTFLKVMDLSGREARTVRSVKVDAGHSWFVRDGKIFLYDIRRDRLQVLTPEFVQARHPLQEVLARYKDSLDFREIQMHPTLPFALLTGGPFATLVHWDPNRPDPKPVQLLGDWQWFTFSPDGKWGAFCKSLYPAPYRTYAVPISERLPHYFGLPILLEGGSEFRENTTGWTPPPTRFVAAKLHEMLWWDMAGDFWTRRVEEDIASAGVAPRTPTRGKGFRVRLHMDAATVARRTEDAFTLLSTNGAYRQTHLLKEAVPAKDEEECVDLEFTDLLPDTSYALEVRTKGQGDPQTLFDKHHYAMLVNDPEP